MICTPWDPGYDIHCVSFLCFCVNCVIICCRNVLNRFVTLLLWVVVLFRFFIFVMSFIVCLCFMVFVIAVHGCFVSVFMMVDSILK